MKKKWKKPELIVLVRSMSAENVLRNCKAANLSGPDVPTDQACTVYNPPGGGPAVPCQSQEYT